jgi:DNA helicase IV
MKWVVPDMDIRDIAVGYRQSRQLYDLTRKIVGSDSTNVMLPDYANYEGVAPVLAKNVTGSLPVAQWLAERIGEIERFVQDLPSVAVFVNSEQAVRSIATDLGDALADRNIRVIPCSDGQVLGRESAVRVFNIQHIKGLEFEAAFFVGIDRLAERYPDLFDKYLYVGATRAATYLGITCEQDLPVSMMGLQKLFGQRW